MKIVLLVIYTLCVVLNSDCFFANLFQDYTSTHLHDHNPTQ